MLNTHFDSSPAWVAKEQRQTLELIVAGGDWTIVHAGTLNAQMRNLHLDASQEIQVDASKLTNLDIVGAWLLRNITGTPQLFHIAYLKPQHQSILDLLDETLKEYRSQHHTVDAGLSGSAILRYTGSSILWLTDQIAALISHVGRVAIETARITLNLRLRIPALLTHIRDTGVNALPGVGLLSFAIGIVLAYQGAEQLRRFGAEQLTINFLGIVILRELGGLLAAVVLAGRSGSAFTAQIGTMKLNQEIDAIGILGLDSVSVLVLPRILGLLIALAVLTLYSDVMSILGGAAFCYFYLHIPLNSFFNHLQTAITVRHVLIGLTKAPVFAVIIAFFGCFEGMRVSQHAESVGKLTTRSVFEAIFLVIIVDAVFSILFSIMGI